MLFPCTSETIARHNMRLPTFVTTAFTLFASTLSLAAMSDSSGPDHSGPLRLGIVKFTTSGYGTADAAIRMRSSLESALLRSGEVDLVDRQHLETLIQEITFQQSGVTSSETTIGLGGISNVEVLLFGEVGRVDAKTFALTIRVIDVASGKVIHLEQANLRRNAITQGATRLGQLLAGMASAFSPASMVTVPGGDFVMGRADGPADEQPAHTVFVDSFAIDQKEVSRAAYALFARQKRRTYDTGGSPRLPAVGISWTAAQEYCRDQGKRLPTEAEWELAARGVEGRPYPWGAQSPQPNLAHFAAAAPIEVDTHLEGATRSGVEHMAGNVAEWVADWWNPRAYHAASERNPSGPAQGEYRVIRGGSFADPAAALRATSRSFHTPMRGGQMIGFRCARTIR
jgi:formylglycine-generating enzyme required for sulfatase activity